MSDPTTDVSTRPDVYSMSAGLPTRPALVDRQCELRANIAKNGGTARAKSQAKLPRTGTFSNSRLPHSNSSQGGLPRGRSFQGVRPLSQAAQAAQDGYYQRKAAKLYVERKRAAAAARAEKEAHEQKDHEPKDALNADVINITVDEKGVMIDGAKGLQGGQGMGSRKSSRSKMTRSSSRQRTSKRLDDKENASLDSDIEDYFRRKRGDHPRRKRDNISDGTGSWDGSMPRRQSSRSFIEENSRSGTSGEGQSSDKKSSQSKAEDTEYRGSVLKDKNTESAWRQRVQLNSSTGNECPSGLMEEKVGVSAATSANSTTAAGPDSVLIASAISNICNDGARNRMRCTDISKDTGSLVEQEEGDIKESVNRESTVLSLPAVSKGQVPAEEIAPGHSSGDGRATLPSSGKWCENCSGVGLHIAALLTELEKQRNMPETGCESPSNNSQWKGWRSIVTQTVLGDSKAKSSSEKARLQQEVEVLRATVDYLYKKVEAMEKGEGSLQ